MEVARAVAAQAMVVEATAAAQGLEGDMASDRPARALEEIKEVASMEATLEVKMAVAMEDMETREAASMAGTSLATWSKMDTEAILILETPAMEPTRVVVQVMVAATMALEVMEPVTLAMVTRVATMVLVVMEDLAMVETLASMEATANVQPTQRPVMEETKVEPKFKPAGLPQAGRS